MAYRRVVRAAVAETVGKKRLAEALALDIPARRKGGSQADDQKIRQALLEARQEIIEAGGEPRSVETLRHYRLTALWTRAVNGPTFRWVDGVPFTAHNEAREAGLTYREFTRMKDKTTDAIRRKTGRAGTDGPAAKVTQSWSQEEKVKAAKALLTDKKVADALVRDLDSRVAMQDAHVRHGDAVDDDLARKRGKDPQYQRARQGLDRSGLLVQFSESSLRFRDMAEALARVDITDQFADAVGSDVHRIDERWEWIKTSIENRSPSLDAGLRALLEEG